MINSFSGEYEFLSNFYPAKINYKGIVYPTSEHAFQAAKTLKLDERLNIANFPTPGQAKRAGKNVTLRDDWENVKLSVMGEILYLKFKDPVLVEKLRSTHGQTLIEGNNWGDVYWGVCNNQGHNWLGEILMQLRDSYMKAQPKKST